MGKSNMITYIYVLKDPETLDIRYVGKTTCIKNRFKAHKSLKATKGTYLASWIMSLRNKGLSPLIETIDTINGSGWKEKESYYIEFYRNKGCKLVNLTSGGEGCEGYTHTASSKEKMSVAHQNRIITFVPSMSGKKHTESSKKKMSDSQMGIKNHNYGKTTSNDIRDKIKKKMGTEVEINGIKYASLREAARKLNMIWSTFKYRHAMGLKFI